MDKFSIPPQARPYTDALRSLIPAGVHATPALDTSCLVDMPVVIAEVGPDVSAAHRAEAFIGCLEQIIEKRLQGVDQKASRILFGLGEYSGMPQRDRYLKSAQLYDPHWKWENFRKEPLDKLLLAIYLKLYREGEITDPAPSALISNAGNRGTAPTRTGLARGNYVTNRLESTYNLPSEPGKPRQFLQVRKITATSDGMDRWRQTARWWRWNVEELPSLTLFGPGTVSIIHDSFLERTDKPGRAYVIEAKLPQPLKAGESTIITLLTQHPVNFDEIVHERWRDWHGLLGVTSPLEYYKVSIHFPPGRIPSTIWYFEDVPDWLAPGIASSDNTIEADSSGFITRTWENLRLGDCYGLAWIW